VILYLFYLYFVLEDEYAPRNEYEELFDISDHLLSPKHEDAPLTTFPGIAEPCKLEVDTHELGATCSDNKGTCLTFVFFLE
jgi:hypothetical protein